jgi:hypothetical protein
LNLVENIPQANLDSWYRWLTILAIGLPIVGAFLGGIAGVAAFMVSNRIGDLQAVALTHAEDTAREAKEFAAPRRLAPWQAANMAVAARELCPRIRRIPVTAANSNQEAQAYALDFVRLFKDAGCASDLQLPIPGVTPDVQGVRIGVRDLANIPAEVGLIDKIFLFGGVKYQINPLSPDFFPTEPFVLLIGAKPT